jgi:hypothetical protein
VSSCLLVRRGLSYLYLICRLAEIQYTFLLSAIITRQSLVSSTNRPKVNAAVPVSCCHVIHDLPVVLVRATTKAHGQRTLSAKSMLQVHVLLEVSDNGFDDRCTFLRVQVVDQVFGYKNSQHIEKGGHCVDCLEERSKKIVVVSSVRIVPVNAVLDSRKRLGNALLC